MATAVSEATMKPHQLQVNRLRREEEEESWISGEELYTEGSSEDESSHHHQHGSYSHHHHNLHHGRHGHDRTPIHQMSPTYSSQDKQSSNPSSKSSHPTIEDLDTTPNIASASEPAMQEQPHLTETTRRLSLMGIEETTALVGAMGGEQHDSLEEQEEIMLWRPKRGSLKLPHIQLDPPSPPKLDVESKD